MATITGLADMTIRMIALLGLVSITGRARMSAPLGLMSIPVATTHIAVATTPLVVATARIIAIGTTLTLGSVAVLAVLDHLEILGLRATSLIRPVNSLCNLPSLEIETGDLHLITVPGRQRAVNLDTEHHDTVNRQLDLRSHPFPRPYKGHELRSHGAFDAHPTYLPTCKHTSVLSKESRGSPSSAALRTRLLQQNTGAQIRFRLSLTSPLLTKLSKHCSPRRMSPQPPAAKKAQKPPLRSHGSMS